jgi:hypothetical protein
MQKKKPFSFLDSFLLILVHQLLKLAGRDDGHNVLEVERMRNLNYTYIKAPAEGCRTMEK